MLGGSVLWSYIAYGLVGLLVAFIAGLVFMMYMASKDEKKRSSALPLLSPEQAEEVRDEFVFASDKDVERTSVPSASAKKPSRTFFKSPSGTASKTPATSTVATDASFFEQDEFDLTEGSDLNTPQ